MDPSLGFPETHLPTQLTGQDRAALEEIRRRKLNGMPTTATSEFTARTLDIGNMGLPENVRWPYAE